MLKRLRFNPRALGVLGMALGALIALRLVFDLAGLRINVTPSIPLGLYIRTGRAPVPGLVAEFCPSGMSATESERYRGFGVACPDRSIPLLKPIVATFGDRVDFSPAGLSVNGRALANTAPRQIDSKGRYMRPWPAGTYTVETGKIVVASTFHPLSYDSRYLGPIPVGDVRSTLRPLWVLNSIDFNQQGTRTISFQQSDNKVTK